ncbi:MAG: hypothetical protein ACLP53_04225, partial [Isosphaeraceae bacterium]
MSRLIALDARRAGLSSGVQADIVTLDRFHLGRAWADRPVSSNGTENWHQPADRLWGIGIWLCHAQ